MKNKIIIKRSCLKASHNLTVHDPASKFSVMIEHISLLWWVHCFPMQLTHGSVLAAAFTLFLT